MNLNVDFSVWKECVACRRLFALAVVVAAIGSCIVSGSIPASYASRARISIDTNDKDPLEKGDGLLSNIKSMLTSSESNVLTEPRVYKEVLESETFYNALRTARVVTADGAKINFADYLATRERKPWWQTGSRQVTDMIKDHVKYEMNTHNYTITIQVELQDGVVACAMVDTVINRLHGYMKTYMRKKAMTDCRNRIAERDKAEAEYHEAMRRMAQFADANFDVERPEVALRLQSLQDEADRLMEIRNEAGVKATMAMMEVERTRPTFIKLVANCVPNTTAHPHWVANFLIWLFYSLFSTLMFVLYRKKYRIWREGQTTNQIEQ